jgi:diacylglycerol O-acyltransferase
MKKVTFSPVDAAWLHMGKPANLAVIVGVMMFDGQVGFEELRTVIEQRLLIYDRFRQRVKEPPLHLGLPQWESDPHFDLNYHLRRLSLPEPNDEVALQELAGHLMGVPLDTRRPLWQFHYVDNYDGGCAIIGRLHHCIADGLALVQVLLSMTDATPEAEWRAPDRPGPTTRGFSLFEPVTQALHATVSTAETLLHEGLTTLAHPSRVIDAAKLGALGTLALSKLVLLSADRKTLFKGQCDIEKRVTWSKPLPLVDVKAVAHALGGTINDVLLAAVAGALRRYLEAHAQPTDGLNIRAMVPVSIRPPAKADELGNQFGLVILSLPVGVRDPVKRMVVLKKRMDEIKDTPEALVAFGILGGMGLTPAQVEDIVVRIFAAKTSAVMTNVPGPRERIYLAGQPLRRIMFWVPQPGNLSLGVSIISYAGEVSVGIATDAGLVPDPGYIANAFNDELAYLRSWVKPDVAPVRKPVKKAPETVIKAARKCTGLTKSGRPCKNNALPNSVYCRMHQPTSV